MEVNKMVYNKYELKLRGEDGVADTIDGIIDGNTYYVYSLIIRNHKVVYQVEPREVVAHVKDDKLYVMKVGKGRRFSMFSAYGRQLYFADTIEEASRAYQKLISKNSKIVD